MIELFIGLIVGFILGSRLKEAFMRLVFRDVLKDLGVTEQQLRKLAREHNIVVPEELPAAPAPEDLPTIEIKIEQHQGQLYAFRTDNDAFLGQGTDRESLIARIAERTQNVKYIVRKDQGADLISNS